MSLIPQTLALLFGRLGRCVRRIVSLDISLDDVVLRDQDVTDQLHYGRD